MINNVYFTCKVCGTPTHTNSTVVEKRKLCVKCNKELVKKQSLKK